MIPTPSVGPELEVLLSAQERFEECRKEWTVRAGRNLCDMAYANPYGGPAPEVVAAIGDALRSDRVLDLQYTPYGGATITRRLIAQRLSQTHGEPFRWRDVVMTPGAMAALNVVFRFLRGSDGGGEVIVLTPCWMDYPLYLTNLGLTPVLVPLRRGTFRLDLDAIERAIGPATRAVVLSQPANPTGVLYSLEELQALAAVLDAAGRGTGNRPWLVSDECHRDVVFGPSAFVPPGRYYDRTLVIYSFGKAYLIQGQRTGYVAVPPRVDERDALARHFERLCRAMGFCTPTALMQLAVRRLLTITPDLGPLSARRARVSAALVEAGYDLPDSEATFFLYPRSPDADDFRFAERLARQGVLVLPAALFHDRGHFRIALTASDEMVDRALRVLRDVLTVSRGS
jgi:aspartate aminotransferase